jgi:hypothetical protein
MRVLRFTFGAMLIVISALLLLGAAALALGLAVGELPRTFRSLGRLGAYLLVSMLCAYAGYRVLRSHVIAQTPGQP